MEGAARAGRNRRQLRRHARPVRGDQRIRRQMVALRGHELLEAAGPAFLRHLQHEFHIGVQLAAALGQHGFQSREVDGVLALVVRRAAPVPAVPGIGERPGKQPGLPLILKAPHRVAMAVEQHGGACRILDPRRGQDRAEAGQRVRVDGAFEAEPVEPGADRVIQVLAQRRRALRLLGCGGDGDQAREQVLETAIVEDGMGARDGAVAGGHGLILAGAASMAGPGAARPPARRQLLNARAGSARRSRA